MPGFTSSSTGMTILLADAVNFNLDKLRKYAFIPEINADGYRSGWVGLGELLDYDNFALASMSTHYVAFSYRIDVRKPCNGAVRLQVSEAVQKEEAEKGHVSRMRKKELRENIIATLTAKADFQPTMTDCLWDMAKNRLYVATSSARVLQPILEHFQTSFGIAPEPISVSGQITNVFSSIHRSSAYTCGEFSIVSMGSANLSAPEQTEEKSSVAVLNDGKAVVSALNEGMQINKIHLTATDVASDLQLDFTLNENLVISGLKFPKPEKGADPDAVFLTNAEICSRTADLVLALSEA